MMKQLFTVAICLMMAIPSQAQNMRKELKKRTAEVGVFGALGYYGNPHWAVGTNIHYLHGIGRNKQWLSIGCGLRINVFNTEDREYTTSSRRLTALNPGGADTLFISEVQTNTLNAYAAIKLHIKQGVDIYFTTDIGGVNFGDSKTAIFRSYETARIETPSSVYKTEPYAFNINVPSGESYGSIVSELYGSFRLNHILRWRLGFQHFRNEYKVDRNIPMNGKRFNQGHYLVNTGIAIDLRWPKTLEQSATW